MISHRSPLRRRLADLFFKDPAEVVCARESAQTGNDVQCVFPVQEKPHGRLDADGRQVASGRHTDCRRKGSDKMTLGDTQTLAQLLDTV